jgi:hypothetical protein
MSRFALRHWTAIAIILIVAGWGVFYLPGTPSWMILNLKRAIDSRQGAVAASYIDFPAVVRAAGYQVVRQKTGDNNVFGELIGRSAVDMLSTPMASVAQSWAQHEVDRGASNVQIPGWAVLIAIGRLKRDGDLATTKFTDGKGRQWIVRMARGSDGRWWIVEVSDIQQLLTQLKKQGPPQSSYGFEPTPDARP